MMTVDLGERRIRRTHKPLANRVVPLPGEADELACGATAAPNPGVVPLPRRTPTRRRDRGRNTRRPPSGLVPVVHSLTGGGGLDQPAGQATEPPYRMSRRARLAITLTVTAGAIFLGLTAVLAGGPTVTTTVTVVAGDTLWSIAQRVAPDAEVWAIVDQITDLNGLVSPVIQPGQVLEVPTG